MAFWHDYIMDHGRLCTFSKGEYMARAGDSATLFGFVISGYVKYEIECRWRNDMQIGGFAFPGALVGDYPRCLYRERSIFSIVAGDNAECCVMEGTRLCDAVDGDGYMERQSRLLVESAYRSLNERYCNMYAKSPKERYADLLRLYPQIIRYVPLKEIASYIGVSPVHLSRIRREMVML